MKKNTSKHSSKHSAKSFILKVFLGIIASILIFILVAIGSAFLIIHTKWKKTNYMELPPSEVSINPTVNENLSEYTTIALLGVDSRADSYTNCRSDGIILISINNKTHEIKICSVYRDTYLDIEGYGLDKVTHAYAFGNAKLALSTLNRNLDLNITKFATVNFETLQKIVDSINGINIYISANEVRFIDGINSAGNHTLNGSQALQYCRIRYTTGGDYVRTERMRNVLIAVFEKAKGLGISELNNLTNTLLPDVYTNISSYEIFYKIPTIASFNIVSNSGWPINVKSQTINGIWYEIPQNLEKQVSLLHEFLFNEINYEPSDVVKEVSSKLP